MHATARLDRPPCSKKSAAGSTDQSHCPAMIRTTLIVTVAAIFNHIGTLQATAAAARPNVVIFLSDDQGWGDLSVHGNANLSTPNIDSLSSDGARFEHFFVCAVCAPTRAEFLTGRYHARGGVRGVSKGEERLDFDETTIADAFQAAGYATAAFGKWHNGTQWPYHPNARGFEEYYGFCSGHWGNYFSPLLEHNGQMVRGEGFIIDDLTNHALDFIEQHHEQPFFCYLPYNTPHSPMQVPDRFYEKFSTADLKQLHRDPKREDMAMTRAALAMCENIDWNVGRVLQKLDELELSNNTIVIYFSDNGPNSWRWNDGMKGRKGSVDEGGLRVPCLMRWPGHIPAGIQIREIAAAIDLLPTLCDLTQVPRVDKKRLDGVSLKPLLMQSADAWPERMIFSLWRNKISVRTQHHRLDEAGELFDMTRDPGQEKAVSDKQPDVTATLREAVTQWREEVVKYDLRDDRPFPVGYVEFPMTVLPARDATARGEIRRSSRAPNCSYFTHWTNTGDAILWDVDIHTTGAYGVEVFYTCPAADVGATIRMSFAGKHIQGKIVDAHDPPLHGAEHDRASRGSESLVKTWRPLDLGTIYLQLGRGNLTLQATDIPGQRVADIRGVRLTLLDEPN